MLLSASKNSCRGFLATEVAAAVAEYVSDLAAANSVLPKILDTNIIIITSLHHNSITEAELGNTLMAIILCRQHKHESICFVGNCFLERTHFQKRKKKKKKHFLEN